MKNFFSEHPFLAVTFTSCMTIIVLGFLTFALFVLLAVKSVGSISSSDSDYDPSGKIAYKTVAGNKDSENKILSIPIKGVILTSEDELDTFSFFSYGFTYGYQIKDQISQASTDDSIKGIILEIDSPGGTISGSKAIYDGVRYYRDITGKPVVAHISGMGASGAYLAALPASEIISDYGSLTGSIGVIMGPFKYYDTVVSEGNFLNSVTTTNGIESYYLTAGVDKDFGDPYKKLSEKARLTLQTDLDNEYKNFVDLVIENRSIEREKIVVEIGALVYDNSQALQLKLVDKIRNRQDAYAQVADLAAVSRDDFKVVKQKNTDFWSTFLSALAPTNQLAQVTQKNCFLCGEMLYIYGTPESYGLINAQE